MTCHSHTWAGVWRLAYRDALALSLFSDVVLFMMDLEFAPDAILLISQPGLGPSMAEFSYEHLIVLK